MRNTDERGDILNGFLIMLMFFTRINVKKEVDFSEEEFVKGMKNLPLIGIIIGALLYAASYILSCIDISGILYGVLLLLIYIFLTGAIHLDGFSDTADGIYSNRDRDRMLEIMQDSRCGAFGVLSLIILALLYTALFMNADRITLLLFPIFSRILILFTCSQFEYAKKDGMGRVFMNSTRMSSFIIWGIIFIAASAYISDFYAIIPIIISLTGFAATALKIRNISKKLGGITGDVLGFSIEYSQLIYLLASAVIPAAAGRILQLI